MFIRFLAAPLSFGVVALLLVSFGFHAAQVHHTHQGDVVPTQISHHSHAHVPSTDTTDSSSVANDVMHGADKKLLFVLALILFVASRLFFVLRDGVIQNVSLYTEYAKQIQYVHTLCSYLQQYLSKGLLHPQSH